MTQPKSNIPYKNDENFIRIFGGGTFDVYFKDGYFYINSDYTNVTDEQNVCIKICHSEPTFVYVQLIQTNKSEQKKDVFNCPINLTYALLTIIITFLKLDIVVNPNVSTNGVDMKLCASNDVDLATLALFS